MINEETYVVEYSVKGKQFHIQELVYAVKYNRYNVLNKTNNDYLIIAVTESYEEAEAFIVKWKKHVQKHNAAC